MLIRLRSRAPGSHRWPGPLRHGRIGCMRRTDSPGGPDSPAAEASDLEDPAPEAAHLQDPGAEAADLEEPGGEAADLEEPGVDGRDPRAAADDDLLRRLASLPASHPSSPGYGGRRDGGHDATAWSPRGGDPYRPWFSSGEPAEPWFTADSTDHPG